MKAEQLKEDVIRAEGYAEGFRDGYLSCAKKIANELAKEEKLKEVSNNVPDQENETHT